jgi:uncharacterized protein YyaL (SSP411 family)
MANRLAGQTSPYLLQHAGNPVDWHPWDDEALQLANTTGKPILLSIGYSACHWCHVMAHESFEDEATARVMNEHFINIKVDREERPDLDKIYQTALQLMSPQGGGWPLTMFLDPQTLLPFYAGTYFPKTPRHQLPGFVDLLLRVSDVFTTKHDELNEQGDKIKDALDQMIVPVLDPGIEDLDLLQAARDQLAEQFDPAEGGFGRAPKFPMPSTLTRILRHWAHERRKGGNDKDALNIVMTTLTHIARGGIYDHIGGGFCRYATDQKWAIPHFEKMLYDNGQLLSIYSQALALGDDDLFADAIIDTIGWLQREMRHPQGGFFAALDADSEGTEGKYYVWRRDQLKKLLSEDEYLIIETLYGLDKPANFEGQWNLFRSDSWRSVVARLSMENDAATSLLAGAKSKLFDARAERIPPARDDKVLTGWNGLVIRGLADAAIQLDRPDWIQLAQEAADFLRTNVWDGEKLLATWTDGLAKHNGYLDDYANVLDGLLSLLSASWRDEDIRFAKDLADALLHNFYDSEQGGFFFTSHDHEQLIHRPKPTMDDALPPGNGTAAIAMAKLGHLLGMSEYIDASANTLRWARSVMERYPAGHCTLLTALEDATYSPDQVILRGDAEDMREWTRALRIGYVPWRSVYAIPYASTGMLPSYIPALVSAETQSQTTAFACSGMQCSAPMTSLDELKEKLA